MNPQGLNLEQLRYAALTGPHADREVAVDELVRRAASVELERPGEPGDSRELRRAVGLIARVLAGTEQQPGPHVSERLITYGRKWA